MVVVTAADLFAVTEVAHEFSCHLGRRPPLFTRPQPNARRSDTVIVIKETVNDIANLSISHELEDGPSRRAFAALNREDLLHGQK